MAGTLVSTVAWTSGDRKSHENCRLSRLDTGWELAGEFHGEEWGEQLSLDYSVQMDAEWRTRLVRLRSTSSVMKPRTCTLSVTPEGVWKQKTGNAAPDLREIAGLSLLEFDFSPAMRTQLVGQLQLKIDEIVDVDVIHVLVPELSFSRDYQVIARTGENSYRCGYGLMGLEEEFTFTFDEHGLVITDELGAISVAE